MTTASVSAVPAGAARRVVGLVILCVALLCSQGAVASALPTQAIIWGSCALACYAAGLLCLVRSNAEDGSLGLVRWKFGPWILLWYGLAFGIATLTWSPFETSAIGQIAASSVLDALWLVATGLTLWTAGYLVGPSRLLMRVSSRWVASLENRFTGAVRGPSTPWILYAVGTAGRLASVATTGRFGYVGDAASAVSTASAYGQILSAISLFAPIAVSVAALQVYSERRRSARLTLLVLFSAELISGAAAGGKESFVVALLAVVVPMSAARHRLSIIAVIVGILAFLVIVIPFNEAYRAVVRGGSTTLSPSEAVHEAPSILRQTLIGQNVITVVPDSSFYLLQRLQEIDSPAIIMQRTPSQISFTSPAQLVEAPVADLVPRAVWPGKPILDTGYEFNLQYYGTPSTVYTSSAITPVGDLYRHGGWIPVVFGMFVLGCGTRLLDDVLDVRRNPQSVFLVLLLFPALVNGEQDWVTLFAGMPSAILVWLAAVALTFRPREST